MADLFISATDLTEYLGRSVDPDKAAIAIDSACDVIRKESNQELNYVADDSVVLDGDGTDVLLLPEMPAYAAVSVTFDKSGDAEYVMVENTDWAFDKEMGAITTLNRDYKFLNGRKLYTVVYSHGYVATPPDPNPLGIKDWPSALRMLALQVAARIYDQQLVQQETVGSYVSIYSAREAPVLTDRERSLLARIADVGRRR